MIRRVVPSLLIIDLHRCDIFVVLSARINTVDVIGFRQISL